MSFIKMLILYFQRRCRSFSLLKIAFSIIFTLLFLIYFLFANEINQLCYSSKYLWLFCFWIDPETTVCSWKNHFPTLSQQINTPKAYEKELLSLPKLQPSFEFNNLTLAKCNEPSIDILIFVISKCSHGSIRQSIRRTWGNTRLLAEYFPLITLKVLFLVDIDSKSEEKIELEYRYHKDIVQVKTLPEQYEYVTERESSIYEFILKRCQQTKFLFKTDDDIFINTFLLLSSIKSFEKLAEQNKYLLFGYPFKYSFVVRHTHYSVEQRYIITTDEYSCPRYPTFLSGFGYLMTYETCSLLFHAYQTDIKPFPLSDVYFTGLLSELFQIQRLTIFPNADYRYDATCSERFFSSHKISFACAASNDHFHEEKSNGDRSLMNDYNLYWTKLREKYDFLKMKDQT